MSIGIYVEAVLWSRIIHLPPAVIPSFEKKINPIIKGQWEDDNDWQGCDPYDDYYCEESEV